jgi:flagellar motor switch/type III secretory pathway protein FliN
VESDDLSIWTLGRARGSQSVAPASSTRAAAAPAARPPAPARSAPEASATAAVAGSDEGGPEAEESEVRVELGRSTIRDPLVLGQVLPLDRLAGESVDIFVDGLPGARGAVPVDGDVLAVRITQTVTTRRPPSRGTER